MGGVEKHRLFCVCVCVCSDHAHQDIRTQLNQICFVDVPLLPTHLNVSELRVGVLLKEICTTGVVVTHHLHAFRLSWMRVLAGCTTCVSTVLVVVVVLMILTATAAGMMVPAIVRNKRVSREIA